MRAREAAAYRRHSSRSSQFCLPRAKNTQPLHHTHYRSSSPGFRYCYNRLFHSARPLQFTPTYSYVTYASSADDHTDIRQKPTSPARYDTTMGAWGFNFFESDHDFDTVSDLSHAAGLDALEAKAKERARQKQAGSENGNATKPAGPTATDEDDDYPLLSIYAGACADVELVRDHLDGGALRKLIDETKAKMEKSDEDDKYADLGRAFATYEFVLLGACAMTLGCKIPDDSRSCLSRSTAPPRLPPRYAAGSGRWAGKVQGNSLRLRLERSH